MKEIKFTLLILGFISYGITVNAQSSITIDASQQMTNFVFVDGTGIQENTFMMFGNEDSYKPTYGGAYSVGYSYALDFGMYIRLNTGMRNAGATMVYDASNYSWDFQYLQTKLGLGYALALGRFNPYMGVSGYFSYLLKATQTVNDEDMDIINSGSIEKNDIGLSIPIGVRIDASDYISVYTEFSYLMGLKNIETSGPGQTANNVAYMVTMGLSFTIK
ncbi:MAG: outer membrane beta-barrel protein [Bacteroidales bacterium]|nr:outer membrane beta-barrel protein [Bacteroidales bacterium]